MRTFKLLRITLFIFTLINNTTIFGSEFFYTVLKYDTLSNLLYDKNLKPIYGKNGSLKKVLNLNPKIKKRIGYRIYPNEKIKIAITKVICENIQQTTDNRQQTTDNLEIRLGEAPKVLGPALASLPPQYSFFRLSPQVSWMKVTANSSNQYQNSSISALSKANPGVLAAYGLQIHEKANAQVFTYLSQVNFYEDGVYTLSKKSFFRQAYGIGGEYKLDPINRFSLRFGFFDEFYLTMNSVSTIDVESAQIPEVHWGYRRILGHYQDAVIDFGLFGKLILPYSASTINGKMGYGLGGDFLLMLKNKGIRLFYNYSDAIAAGKSTQTLELGWNVIFEGRMYE